MLSRTTATMSATTPSLNQDSTTYFEDSRLLFEECWLPNAEEFQPSYPNTTYYQPCYSATFSNSTSDSNPALRVDQVFNNFVIGANSSTSSDLQSSPFSGAYITHSIQESPTASPKITSQNASPIFIANIPQTPSPPPISKPVSKSSTSRKEKKGQNQRKKDSKGNGSLSGSDSIQKKRKLKKKKTLKACVYCRHSHSCCDNFRPCSKCSARGIGHLCKESNETTTIASVNKIVKEIKKKSTPQVNEEILPTLTLNIGSHKTLSLATELTVSQLISLPPPSPSIFQTELIEEEELPDLSSGAPLPPMPASISFPQEIYNTLNFAKRPFPKDECLAFHRLAKHGGWTSELISMWFKTEEFYRWKKSAEAAALISNVGYRDAVMKGALAILSTLDESSEPTVIWAEGLRVFAANKAALKFFNRSFDEMCNKAHGYVDDMEDFDESLSPWNLERDILESQNIVRLFDLIHKDDAISFALSAATDAMSLYPLDFYANKGEPPAQVSRGFRIKVRLSITKESCSANIVPLIKNLANFSLNDSKKEKPQEPDNDHVVCLVTQSQYRDPNKRFLFASCTFNRIDDLE